MLARIARISISFIQLVASCFVQRCEHSAVVDYVVTLRRVLQSRAQAATVEQLLVFLGWSTFDFIETYTRV